MYLERRGRARARFLPSRTSYLGKYAPWNHDSITQTHRASEAGGGQHPRGGLVLRMHACMHCSTDNGGMNELWQEKERH